PRDLLPGSCNECHLLPTMPVVFRGKEREANVPQYITLPSLDKCSLENLFPTPVRDRKHRLGRVGLFWKR
ncbi:hypothetical protein NPIL_39271, partial [Nephila pilipes]